MPTSESLTLLSSQAFHRHLVLGGARSGKSAYAEKCLTQWQLKTGGQVTYIATSRYHEDSEMLERISHHRRRRPSNWQTIEEPIYLSKVLEEVQALSCSAKKPVAILLDCLTLWMLNLIEADCRQAEVDKLVESLETFNCPIVIVSNEVGLGVVPMGKLSREFVDELGRLHQAIAAEVDEVTFVTAGLPMKLK